MASFTLSNFIVVEVEIDKDLAMPIQKNGYDESDLFQPPCSDLTIERTTGTLFITDRGTNNRSIFVGKKELQGTKFRVGLDGSVTSVARKVQPLSELMDQ